MLKRILLYLLVNGNNSLPNEEEAISTAYWMKFGHSESSPCQDRGPVSAHRVGLPKITEVILVPRLIWSDKTPTPANYSYQSGRLGRTVCLSQASSPGGCTDVGSDFLFPRISVWSIAIIISSWSCRTTIISFLGCLLKRASRLDFSSVFEMPPFLKPG